MLKKPSMKKVFFKRYFNFLLVSLTAALFFGLCFFIYSKEANNTLSDNFLKQEPNAFSDVCQRLQPDPSLPELTQEDKEYLISLAYVAVYNFYSGKEEMPEFPEEYEGINNKVFIGFNVNGSKKASWSAKRNNLAESVYLAAWRSFEDTRFSGGMKEEDRKDLKIEVFILGDEKKLTNLRDFELGVHGLRVENGSNQATYYNSVAIEGNYRLDKLLQKLCKKAGMEDSCAQDSSTKVYYFNTLNFASTRFSDNIITFYRSNTVSCNPYLELSDIRESADLAISWLINNVRSDGSFNYQYYPANGNYPNLNNMIRFWMSARTLGEFASQKPELMQMHKKNINYGLEKWYKEEGNVGYILFDDKSKLGANGMALRTLVASPYFADYEDKARKLAESIIAIQGSDGSLKSFYKEPDYSYDSENLLTYYSGEALLGLIEFYSKTGEKRYLDAAVKSQDYFIVEYVDKINENYYPAYVPWHTMSLYKLYMITKDERYVDAIFKMNDKLIEMQNVDGLPYPDYLGRFYDPEHPEYGVPFSGSTGVYVDGLSYAYMLARMKGDAVRMRAYKNSIILGSHNLINLQFKGPNMYYLSRPERVEGAVRYRVDDNRIRIDTTQHAIDAFINVIKVFDEKEFALDI